MLADLSGFRKQEGKQEEWLLGVMAEGAHMAHGKQRRGVLERLLEVPIESRCAGGVASGP